MSLTVIKEFVPVGRPNRPGRRLEPTSVTIHNTSNTNRGADAKAHSRFVREKGSYIHNGRTHWVSWHFTVDDKVVIQQLPINEVAYHAGRSANSSSLAIEICMNQGIDQEQANRNAAIVTANLLSDLGLKTSAVKRHRDWTGKNCPQLLMSETDWKKFIKLVQAALNQIESTAPEYRIRAFELGELAEESFTAQTAEDFEIDHDAFAAQLTDENAFGLAGPDRGESSSGFTRPPAQSTGRVRPEGRSSDVSAFERPPSASSQSDGDGWPSEDFSAVTEEAGLEQLHSLIEGSLFSAQAAGYRGAVAASASSVHGLPPAIVGVGIGPAHRDFESIGPLGPGAPVVNVYVTEAIGMEEVKRLIHDDFGITALSSDRMPVNVFNCGVIDAYAHRHRERPAPCGISIGHTSITAGTLGALARGRRDPRRARLLALSNNHVIANNNNASAGDTIVQSGPIDGGRPGDDRIGVLEKWVEIEFGSGINYVDAATAWIEPAMVRREFVYPNGRAFAYFRVGARPTTARVGMSVGKSGRTTQLTGGRVVDVSASLIVNYGSAGKANFRDQISIQGHRRTKFSSGGDSGSLVWEWSTDRAPIGLLYAGGQSAEGPITFANKIHRVLDALDIELYT